MILLYYTYYIKQTRLLRMQFCRATGCTRHHYAHFCKNCGSQDSNHRSRDCYYLRCHTANNPQSASTKQMLQARGLIVPQQPHQPLQIVGASRYGNLVQVPQTHQPHVRVHHQPQVIVHQPHVRVHHQPQVIVHQVPVPIQMGNNVSGVPYYGNGGAILFF